jgi:hypothetical protein
VKNRGSLLKSLVRLDRRLQSHSVRIKGSSRGLLNSGDTEELAHTARQIARTQLAMRNLSRELACVSRGIRVAVLGHVHCVATPSTAGRSGVKKGGNGVSARRSAFAAIRTKNGAFVARVLEETPGVWPQMEYARFETWTEAQGFATTLNQRYGIDVIEAQHIIVSASLAAATSCKQKS